MVALSYLDLSFDSILLGTVIGVLGSGLQDTSLFTTQISILLLTSILVPSLMTAINIAHKRPLVVLGWSKWTQANVCEDKKSILLLRILIVCLFPIVPALVLLSDYEAKEKRKTLEENSAKVNFSSKGGFHKL